jgi:enamine deaminase RidA (YjgF/YER057c/UK114 family)
MPKEIISTPEAPQSPMYSQAVKAGNTIYVAGTTGVDVTTGEFAAPRSRSRPASRCSTARQSCVPPEPG